MPHSFQLGLDTFGDVTVDRNGSLHSHAHTLRDVITEAALAEAAPRDTLMPDDLAAEWRVPPTP